MQRRKEVHDYNLRKRLDCKLDIGSTPNVNASTAGGVSGTGAVSDTTTGGSVRCLDGVTRFGGLWVHLQSGILSPREGEGDVGPRSVGSGTVGLVSIIDDLS